MASGSNCPLPRSGRDRVGSPWMTAGDPRTSVTQTQSVYRLHACSWRAPGGDGGHGGALGDIGGHRSLVGAEPVEQAEDHRAEAEIDEQDGQRLCDAVAVEV